MISQEDYNLQYNQYLADAFLESSLDNLELKSLTGGTEVIQEDFKETITKYVTKVVNGISAAWNKFKDNVSAQKLKYNDKDITEAISGHDPKVQVQNYVEYDTDVMQNLDVRAMDYNTMKNDLEDKNTFLKKYYTSVFTDENKSFYENLKTKASKSKADKHDVTKDELNVMYAYMKNHKTFLDKVSKDLDEVNKAAKNVDFVVSNIQRTSTAESYFFTEADEKENQVVKPQDSGNSNGESTNGNNEQKNDETKTITKAVQVYFQSTSEILSAEMKLSREIYKFYETVVMQHVTNVKGEAKEKKQEQPSATTTTNTGTPQINTSAEK